jgi:hypothetical protein
MNYDKFDGSENAIKALGIGIGRYLALSHPFATPHDSILFKNKEEFTKVQNLRKGIAQIQNLSTTADFPEFLNDLFKQFLDKPISDIGYQAIYDIRNLSGSDGWDVYTETSDFEFPLIYPGGRISYYTHSGAKYRSYVDYYGGGNGIDQRLIDSRDFVSIERMIELARSVVMKKEAQVAYALIEAIGSGQNIAWQNPDPAALANTDATYTANRDAQTLCKAAETLITNNKDKGLMPDGLNTTFWVLHPYQLQKRLQKANSLRLQSFDNSNREISTYNFVFINTTLLAASTSYYVGIPKGKMTGGILLNLTQFTQFSQSNYMQDIAHWKAFGFDIGDEEQIQRCATS